MTSSIDVEFANGLAILSLAQPQRGNPIDQAFILELKARALWLWQCPGLRCVLLRSTGRDFSFGGDLRSFHEPAQGLPALVHSWTADLHTALQRLWALPVPLVVQVQGAVMGGALSLAAGCDIVIASNDSKFGSAFARIGLSCDSGTSATLTARMGMARARRFVLTAEVLDSTQALTCGLVDEVVAPDQVAQRALGCARQMAQGPTAAYGEIKGLFLRASLAQLQGQLEAEALAMARVAATQDANEGIAALLGKRAASFAGR
jgi:2-(1,2-epoxy-1,2-dihydrophenyl)acetyl-CoA isomerase